MISRPFRSRVASLVLLALAPLALDGCVSVGIARSLRDATGAAGEIAVSIYGKPAERDAGVRVGYPVLAELLRVDGDARTTVARSMASSWTVPDVPPGRYELRVTRKIDENGDVVPLRKPSSKEFDVRAGERVDAKVVLEKVPVGWIILAAITIVVLVVLAIKLANEGKLPPPPPLPHLDHFVGVAVSFPIRGTSGPRAVEPGVADVFPAPGSVVAARRVSVSFLMTTALGEGDIGKEAVLAVGSVSGEIPGDVSWDPEDQLLRFAPSVDFRSGETVTVTLDLEKVESRGGRSGSGRVSTSFRVP